MVADPHTPSSLLETAMARQIDLVARLNDYADLPRVLPLPGYPHPHAADADYPETDALAAMLREMGDAFLARFPHSRYRAGVLGHLYDFTQDNRSGSQILELNQETSLWDDLRAVAASVL
ncbi:MAG: hypothetical protein ACYCW6_04795 [Candidatus Xenobia bacterium]